MKTIKSKKILITILSLIFLCALSMIFITNQHKGNSTEISNVITLTFNNADGTFFDEKEVNIGDPITLPTYSCDSSKVFIGWGNGEDVYKAGESYQIDSSMEFTAKIIDFIQVKGARLRLSNTIDDCGLRFEFIYNTQQFNDLSSNIVEYGAILSPEKIVGKKEFILDNFIEGSTILKVVADSNKNQVSGDETIYRIALTNIKVGNYNNDFCARGYIKVRYVNNIEGYAYTDFTLKNNSRSVAYVANYFRMFDTKYFNNLYQYQKDIINTYAYYYVADREVDLPII